MTDNNLVYSTGSGRISATKPQPKSAASKDGIVRIRRETKGRKGKGVTLIDGLDMSADELKKLCTELKKMCGTGGAIKQGIIEIQGDNRDKVKAKLEASGMKVKLAGG